MTHRKRSGLPILLVAACVAATLAGCGSSSNADTTTAVRLTLAAPADDTKVAAGAINVSGTVSPWQANVLVAGHAVTVNDDGSFTTSVPLAVGANLIDVIAGAPHAQSAMNAIRVVRLALVAVPKVDGKSDKDAKQLLTAAGFKAKIDGSSDLLDDLIPGSSQVCSQSPKSGTKVVPGSTVTLHTAKICL